MDKPRRLTYKEKKELETLPGQIEELGNRTGTISTPSWRTPGCTRKHRQRVVELKKRFEEVEKELAAGYARWEELDAFKADA